MRYAAESFIEYGGHAQAGGFSVGHEEVHALERALNDAHAKLASEERTSTRTYDAELVPGDITWDLYRSVAQFAPFGEANPKPIFLLRAVHLESVRLFGKGSEHLEVSIARSQGRPLKAIAFFTKPDAFGVPLVEGMTVSLAVHLEASYFGGKNELRLRLLDVM
jgi:single-stranded-DNA-specific exonuclease